MPPIHMPICHGSVISKKLPKSQGTKEGSISQVTQMLFCFLCSKTIEDKPLKCLDPTCDLVSHIVCLSKKFLQMGEYIPIDGECPKCKKNFYGETSSGNTKAVMKILILM